MVPCWTRRWFLAVRAQGLNGEPITAWGLTRTHAVDRWMRRYTNWLDTTWAVDQRERNGE